MPSLGKYCQGLIRYRIACQALADTAKAWLEIAFQALVDTDKGIIRYRIACQALLLRYRIACQCRRACHALTVTAKAC